MPDALHARFEVHAEKIAYETGLMIQAARALRYTVIGPAYRKRDYAIGLHVRKKPSDRQDVFWSSLEDNDDAFAMLVKMRLPLTPGVFRNRRLGVEVHPFAFEPYAGDENAAARRAITMAVVAFAERNVARAAELRAHPQ